MKPIEFGLIIFMLQGAAIFFDEFYFHHKRGLPLWERIGHPMDTLSILAPFAMTITLAPSETNLTIFIALSVFSCLLITKDEFVHTKFCSGGENWLHAVLFVLHPLALLLAVCIWRTQPGLMPALKLQTALISTFLVYQIVYWGFLCNVKKSTTRSTTNSARAGTPPMTIPSRS